MTTPLPHESVYVRLGVSPIHGIGVFAIRPIPTGTNIFASDRVNLVWVDRERLAETGLSPDERALYEDFAIRRGDTVGCPVDFNNLTPGWYLNEPPAGEDANVQSTRELGFFAVRDIAPGEELTINYSDFNE
jgi:hypothetical protein